MPTSATQPEADSKHSSGTD